MGGGVPPVGSQALRTMDDGKEGAGWYTVVFLRESYRASLTERMDQAGTKCEGEMEGACCRPYERRKQFCRNPKWLVSVGSRSFIVTSKEPRGARRCVRNLRHSV